MDEIREVTVRGESVCVNSAVIAQCICERSAEFIADVIRDVAYAPQDERAQRLESAIAASMSVEAVADAHRAVQLASRDLRFTCNALFTVLFIGAPLMVWWAGLARVWSLLLPVVVALWALAILDYVRAHRQLFPTRRAQRRHRALLFGLTPLGAIRACDAIARDALAPAHPLAAARVLCDDETFWRLATQTYADLTYAVEAPDEAASDASRLTEVWFRDRLLQATRRCIQASITDPEALLRPPAPEDPTCLTYCPRCRTQYVVARGDCPRCPGIELRVLAERAVCPRGNARADDGSGRASGVTTPAGLSSSVAIENEAGTADGG